MTTMFLLGDVIHRIFEVARTLKVTSGEIMEFLKALGYPLPRGPNQPLTDEMYGAVLYRFNPREFESLIHKISGNGEWAAQIKSRVDALIQKTSPPPTPTQPASIAREPDKTSETTTEKKTVVHIGRQSRLVRIIKQTQSISPLLMRKAELVEDVDKFFSATPIFHRMEYANEMKLMDLIDQPLAPTQKEQTTSEPEDRVTEPTPAGEIPSPLETFSTEENLSLTKTPASKKTSLPQELTEKKKRIPVRRKEEKERGAEFIHAPSWPRVRMPLQPIKLSAIDLELIRLLFLQPRSAKRKLLEEFLGLK